METSLTTGPSLSLFLVLGFQIYMLGSEAWAAPGEKRGSGTGLPQRADRLRRKCWPGYLTLLAASSTAGHRGLSPSSMGIVHSETQTQAVPTLKR